MAQWPLYQFMRHQTAGSILAGMFTNCTMACDSYHRIRLHDDLSNEDSSNEYSSNEYSSKNDLSNKDSSKVRFIKS
jgi:hypothetical protein